MIKNGKVAEANPLKQGLKPHPSPLWNLGYKVAEANPLKQGLKLINFMCDWAGIVGSQKLIH